MHEPATALARPARRTVLFGAAALAGCAPATAFGAESREQFVPVDGASLYLLVRGRPAGPVLVWLHGGPGGAERPLFRLYNRALERTFRVAYLDQRGAGRSFDAGADPRRLTIAQHLADLDRVVDFLRTSQGASKVILIGHSWGSALGLLYARDHPEKVAAFLGVGQVTSELARQRSQWAFVEREAQSRGDGAALARLREIGPPPFTADREIAVQRLVERFGGYWRGQPNFALLTLRGMAAGVVTPLELRRILQGNAVSLRAMNQELLGLDLPRDAPRVEVPVGFLLGRHDRQVDAALAAAYFDKLQAPAKRLVWFDTAHNVPFEAPDAFNAAVPRVVAELGVTAPA